MGGATAEEGVKAHAVSAFFASSAVDLPTLLAPMRLESPVLSPSRVSLRRSGRRQGSASGKEQTGEDSFLLLFLLASAMVFKRETKDVRFLFFFPNSSSSFGETKSARTDGWTDEQRRVVSVTPTPTTAWTLDHSRDPSRIEKHGTGNSASVL